MKNFNYAKMGAIIAIIICIVLLLGSALSIRAYGEEPVIEDMPAGAQLLNPGHSGINIQMIIYLWSLIGIVFIIKELINDKRKH